MNYRDLYNLLKEWDKNGDYRLDDDVTIYDPHEGEYYPAEVAEFEGDDVLDDKHLFICPREIFTDN